VKTPAQVAADVTRRLQRTWATELVSGANGEGAWPHRFPLGTPTGTKLDAEFTKLLGDVRAWRDWATRHDVELVHATRRVRGTDQTMPTHVVIDDIDTAARVVGTGWPARLATGRHRSSVLTTGYSHLKRPEKALTQVVGMADVDFDLLCRAANWFASHEATGLTPRQVPIEGLHAKWLNTRHQLLQDLAGLDDLGLAPAHPSRIHFTYLDAAHLAAGGRRHDSATVGDTAQLAYSPSIVLISENKDTAIHFPPIPGGVAVEGNGRGARAYATFDWLREADTVVYWGDMDADGLEILNEFREAGVPAKSMFMDPTAYGAWSKYGTDVDKRGQRLTSRDPRQVPHLTDEELSLYRDLCSPQWASFRRVEQERIPLATAARALQEIASHQQSPQPSVSRGPEDSDQVLQVPDRQASTASTKADITF
jgi:hypothetical protein